ncbi:MAG: response regulator transcription factor [Comamonas sp.]|uniref:response regulator transcription factor n=2 Tax=Comamonas sp. TaxID=34028 RepID=UPI002FCBF899
MMPVDVSLAPPAASSLGASAAQPPQSHAFSSVSARPSTRIWPDFLVGQVDKPVRVLLIDDDAHIRMVIAQELMADERTLLVAQASSIKEGRKAIRQHAFDVMLVDMHLGDGEGLELIDFMKTLHPSAEAVVVSIMESDDLVLRAFELGATGYLIKNSWFGNYPMAVLQVANGGASITPNLARRLLQRFDKTAVEEVRRRQPDEAERLSAREREVLRMVAGGYTSVEIGVRLAISSMTVNTHIKNIYRKLQVRTRAQAVRFASLRGMF